MQQVNGVRLYNLTAGKTEVEFFEEARKTGRSLRYNDEFRNRFEMIQDFEMPAQCAQVAITRDQRHIVAAGGYGPQIRIFDLAELSQKCMRGLDSEVVKFALLGTDYEKAVFACADRNLQFHTKFGRHYKTRVPKFPRDLSFNPHLASLAVAASAPEIYRLDLEVGKFLAPFESSAAAVNSLSYNPRLNVLLAGTENGVEVWDCRERSQVAQFSMGQVNCVEGEAGGLTFGTGSREGVVSLWDIRQSASLLSVEHHYKDPITTIRFHQGARKVLSSSRLVLNIHSRDTGKLFTCVEPEFSLNSFELVPGSGLLLLAQESPRIGAFFVPALDRAPGWIPYLQNMTEELQAQKSSLVYDQYKFLLPEEVEDLQCADLVGTKALRPHLHGYLMQLKLYRKLEHRSSKTLYTEYRQKTLADQLDSQVPKPVKDSVVQEPSRVAADPRFSRMSGDERFRVDRLSEDYLMRHPNEKGEIEQQRREKEGELRRVAGKLGRRKKIGK